MTEGKTGHYDTQKMAALIFRDNITDDSLGGGGGSTYVAGL